MISSTGRLPDSLPSETSRGLPSSKKTAKVHKRAGPLREFPEDPDIPADERKAMEDPKMLVIYRAPPTIAARAVKDGPVATQPPASSGSKKRKSAPETTLAEEIAAYKQPLYHVDVKGLMDMDCDQIRQRIYQVLDGGIMKKTEFCSVIGCEPRSLTNFLLMRGKAGGKTKVYIKAWVWFKTGISRCHDARHREVAENRGCRCRCEWVEHLKRWTGVQEGEALA